MFSRLGLFAAAQHDGTRRQLECSAVILAADQVRAGHQSQNREGARPQIPDKLLALADEVIE
jgi:hypothetical protein